MDERYSRHIFIPFQTLRWHVHAHGARGGTRGFRAVIGTASRRRPCCGAPGARVAGSWAPRRRATPGSCRRRRSCSARPRTWARRPGPRSTRRSQSTVPFLCGRTGPLTVMSRAAVGQPRARSASVTGSSLSLVPGGASAFPWLFWTLFQVFSRVPLPTFHNSSSNVRVLTILRRSSASSFVTTI